MEPFTRLTAVAAPIDLPNVDTDRIIPARFLRKPQGPELGRYLFHDVRFDAQGAERPDFVLNQPAFRDARILVASHNFACGSSREAAVWTLMAAGVRAVIAPSFGDIFAQNCGKNGALAVVLPADTVAGMRRALRERPGGTVTVDLPAQTVTGPDGASHAFEINAFLKTCLLRGEDEIAMTLGHEAAIAAFEARHREAMPWLHAPPRDVAVTERAAIVIVGGGVMGASIAYHLALRGVRDVTVLEKGVVASGATGKSSACVRQHYSTPQTCRMALEALRFFEQAAERLGGREVGFVRTGCLLMADGRLEKEMAATVELQRTVGIGTRLVSPGEMRAIEPRLATDDVVTGCFEAESGYADPVATAQAFAGAARDLGARIREETEVTGLVVSGSRVGGVETSRGRVEAPVVINAAGLWSDRVARMAGVDLPITVCRHKISIVAWPEGARGPHPMVYDFAGSIYTRPEAGGHILVGPLDDETPDRADPDRYREGVSFEESLEALARAGRRFPVLEGGAVARGYAGCFDVTPDWHPVIDQAGPSGLYAVAGFSGHGFKLSPAVGRMVAALVLDGKRPGDDVDAFRLSRFAEGKPIRGTYGDWLMC